MQGLDFLGRNASAFCERIAAGELVIAAFGVGWNNVQQNAKEKLAAVARLLALEV